MRKSAITDRSRFASYRLLSKMLANRLSPLLTALIGKEQSAFLSGRSINDNILLVQKFAHSMSAQQIPDPY